MDEITDTVDKMEKEAIAIREESFKLCWYMRGGLTYQEAATLSPRERELIGKIIKDNLETTKKSGLPFF